MLVTIILNGVVSLAFGFTTNIVYAFVTRFLTGLVNGKCHNHKNPKNLDTRKICSNHPKIQTRCLYHRATCPKDADGMANSVDPDQ